MSQVLPFRGLRPKKEFADRVASPPYDVLDSDEAREMAKDNAHSFLHIIKPEIDFPPDQDPYDHVVYLQGRENLRALIQRQVLVQDEKPRYYVYKQIMGDHEQTGLVACASVEEYLHGKIKKHEHTQAQKVQDRLRLATALQAQTGPVFLTFRDTQSSGQLLKDWTNSQPEYDFTAGGGVRHQFYVVDNDNVNKKIFDSFEKLEALYIADGHHRSEMAAQLFLAKQKERGKLPADSEYRSFLTVIFPHSEMMILPYNRAIQNFNGFRQAAFVEKINQIFHVEPVLQNNYKPEAPQTFGIFLAGKWLKLTPRKREWDAKDPIASLDVAILQNLLFEPLFNITDQRTDKRLKFVGGTDGVQKLEKLVKSGEYAAAFSLYPTSMEQVMRVADIGQVMPPKSTWFEPKLLSGLVTHLLE